MQLDEASFRALARSSPWRWSTVRFTCSWSGPFAGEDVRAWVARPDRLRVESLEGRVLQAGVEDRSGRFSLLFSTVTAPAGEAPVPHRGELLEEQRPRIRRDGLVERRGPDRYDHDVPMYRNYHWVAMLDPVELTDGQDLRTGGPAATAGTVIEDLGVVEHAGRPAWEAVLRPVPGYDPRCSCCALLPSAEADALDDWRKRDGAYADAFRVRLDVGTGICVLTEELGGERSGAGHALTIEAVDDAMGDGLFVREDRGRGAR